MRRERDIILSSYCCLSFVLAAVFVATVARADNQPNKPTQRTEPTKSIHDAVAAGDIELVKSLISHGADVNAEDNYGYTPLVYAIWGEDKELIRLLITRGADVNFTPKDSYPPLHYAVWQEDPDTVKLLVANGAKFDVKDQDGATAFRAAVSQGSREIVEFFLSKGADVSTLPTAACMGDSYMRKRTLIRPRLERSVCVLPVSLHEKISLRGYCQR